MEKKGSRSVLPSPKGTVTDIKKSQDNAGGKLWPRGCRRREPSGGSFPAKNETSRNLQQRNKPFCNKQPRPRNVCYGGNSRREEAGVEEYEPEIGSVMAKGSKKQNINHLLNFQLAPHVSQSGGINVMKPGSRWNSSGKHKYNKEQFLQANCQFIVKTSGDYRLYMNNPDALVDWDLIEQVNIEVGEMPSCPICLYPPVAAKMTRCGHIYCWSCVLHYLALSEKTWGKCPICYEAIHNQDLKSVVTILHSPYNINENITFKLMKKLRGSLIAYPADSKIVEQDCPLNLTKANANVYSKLLTASKADVLDIIERERTELSVMLADDENTPEKCFIEQAISLLGERESFVLGQIEARQVDQVNNNPESGDLGKSCLQLEKMCLQDGVEKRSRFESTSSENLESEISFGSDATSSDIVENTCNTKQPSKYIYFYQASDGQHIYLQTVNAKMLEHTYGSLELSPNTITGRVLEKESCSINEEIRKRNKYLQHLPITCPFELIEINMNQPLITKETKDLFQDQIQQRQRRRQRRTREEKRREKRITEEENRKIGRYPEANIKLESYLQFPTFQEETVRDRNESESTDGAETLEVTPSSSIENAHPGMSFAKMLSSSSNRKAPVAWPEIKPKGESPALKLINVTGQQLKVNVVRRNRRNSDSEPDCEDYVPAPSFNSSLIDSFELALERAAANNANDNNGDQKPTNGKKKKKNKHQVLFSTNMPYASKRA